MSQKWILLTFIALICLLSVSALLYMRLGKWDATVSLPTDSEAATACGQLPHFEFLHVYNPIDLAGGRFTFENVGHLCLERIELVSGQELLLHLSYNTGFNHARIILPARIMVATQREPTRHGPVRVGELTGYLGALPARVTVRLRYGLDIDNFDPKLAAAETRENLPSWASYDWEAYYAPLAQRSLSTEQLRQTLVEVDTKALEAVVVMDVDRMRGF
jgi:hypothetical protein